jgi:hypothetical protein
MIRFWNAWRRGDRYTAKLIFQEMWRWPQRNAMVSHDERPWGSWNRSRMMNALHPDEFWF